jgi:predicted dehydrogenase
MTRQFRVAVIGRTGKGDYGHGLDTVWLDVPNVEIVAVADEDEKGRSAAATRLKTRYAYADYRDMLSKERPHVVSIAPRWPDCHRDMAVACAQAGASILLEKPLCRTLAEADDIITACERCHVKLAVAHQTRYSPRLRRVRELIAAGRIGDVVELRGRGKEDRRGGGQDLMVLGTHIFDLMRALVGDASWCFAQVSQRGRPITKADIREGEENVGPIAGDRVDATYGFAKGVVGTFGTQQARHRAADRFGLSIYGTKGVLGLRTGGLPAVYLLEDASWGFGAGKAGAWKEVTSAGIDKPEPLADRGLALGNELMARDLLEAIEKDRQPQGSMYDGRAALEMILAAYESQRIKGPVTLPMKERRHPLRLF